MRVIYSVQKCLCNIFLTIPLLLLFPCPMTQRLSQVSGCRDTYVNLKLSVSGPMYVVLEIIT